MCLYDDEYILLLMFTGNQKVNPRTGIQPNGYFPLISDFPLCRNIGFIYRKIRNINDPYKR